jgi:hypothetical protein
MGPMRITAPPLTPFRLETDPNVMSSIPMNTIANAMKNSQVASENEEPPPVIVVVAPGFNLAWQSKHDQ